MTNYIHTQTYAYEQQSRINHLLKMLSNKIDNAPKAIQPSIVGKVKHLETVRFDAFTADQLATEIEKANTMIEKMIDDYNKEQLLRPTPNNTNNTNNTNITNTESCNLSYKSFKDCWYWDIIREMILSYLEKASISEYDPIVASILNHVSEDFSYVIFDKNGYYIIRPDKTQELYNKIYSSYLSYDKKYTLVWSEVDKFINNTVSKDIEINTQNLVYKLHELIEQNPDKYINVSNNINYLKNSEDFTKLINEIIPNFTTIPAIITDNFSKVYLYNYQNYIKIKNQQYYYTETELISINKSVCKELLVLKVSINDVNKVYDVINNIFNNVWQYLPIRRKIIEILDFRLIKYNDDMILKILQSVYFNWNMFRFYRDNWGRYVISNDSVQTLNDLINEH